MTRVRFTGKRTASIIVTLLAGFAAWGCALGSPSHLDITAPTTTLRVGETVQLSVTERLPGGATRDVTSPAAGTTYYTTGESVLIPEPDGRVTCIGTSDRDRESAVIGAANGEHHGSLRFQLLPAGPGPGLEVTAATTVLHEGEAVQLGVFRSSPEGRRDLTAIATGTRYLTFAGNAMVDSSVITVSDAGLASAVSSIGRFNYRTVIVFVRNADVVGWTVVKVIPR